MYIKLFTMGRKHGWRESVSVVSSVAGTSEGPLHRWRPAQLSLHTGQNKETHTQCDSGYAVQIRSGNEAKQKSCSTIKEPCESYEELAYKAMK